MRSPAHFQIGNLAVICAESGGAQYVLTDNRTLYYKRRDWPGMSEEWLSLLNLPGRTLGKDDTLTTTETQLLATHLGGSCTSLSLDTRPHFIELTLPSDKKRFILFISPCLLLGDLSRYRLPLDRHWREFGSFCQELKQQKYDFIKPQWQQLRGEIVDVLGSVLSKICEERRQRLA